MNESILITGANIGLGKETARQLALKPETKKVILFCRNQAKAEAAKKDLEEQTGRKIFEIVIGDVSDVNSVRKAVEKIKDKKIWLLITKFVILHYRIKMQLASHRT